jgi:putative nucleotidyltransferase with HDIG domain
MKEITAQMGNRSIVGGDLKVIVRVSFADSLMEAASTSAFSKYVRDLASNGKLHEYIPEFDRCETVTHVGTNFHHGESVLEHTLEVLDRLDKVEGTYGITVPPIVKIAGLFHDIGKPDTLSMRDGKATFYGHDAVGSRMLGDIMARLGFDHVDIETVEKLVQYHMRAFAFKPETSDNVAKSMTDRKRERDGVAQYAPLVLLINYADHGDTVYLEASKLAADMMSLRIKR